MRRSEEQPSDAIVMVVITRFLGRSQRFCRIDAPSSCHSGSTSTLRPRCPGGRRSHHWLRSARLARTGAGVPIAVGATASQDLDRAPCLPRRWFRYRSNSNSISDAAAALTLAGKRCCSWLDLIYSLVTRALKRSVASLCIGGARWRSSVSPNNHGRNLSVPAYTGLARLRSRS